MSIRVYPWLKKWENENELARANHVGPECLSRAAKQGTNPKLYLRNANVQWGRIETDDLYEMDFEENLARPRNGNMLPEFLAHHMMHAFLLSNTYGLVGTKTTIAHLPGVKLKALLIPVPSTDNQEEIVQALDRIDEKEKNETSKLEALTQTFNSLLHELMTGQRRVHDLDLEFADEDAA